MEKKTVGRRSFLALTGASVSVGAFGEAAAARSKNGWTVVPSPGSGGGAGIGTSAGAGATGGYNDVTHTVSDAYAVGTGGAVVHRTESGWREVVGDGPAGAGNDLYAVNATEDGEAIWVAGAGGALGRYDVTASKLTDHSAPAGVTNALRGVDVDGPNGDERIALTSEAGELVLGEPTDGGYRFRVPELPGGESGLFPGTGPVGTVSVGGERAPIRAVDRDGARGLAAGANGVTYDRVADGEWKRVSTPARGVLSGVSLGGEFPDVAVGANGLIVERTG